MVFWPRTNQQPTANLERSLEDRERDFEEAPRTNISVESNGQQRKPRIGCAGIVRRGNEVLLGKRDKDPARGLWVLPGGGVDFGETFAETLQREMSEEVGIQIDVEGIFNVCELINPPHEHRVIVYLNARYRSGRPVASSDLSDVRFFDADELKQMSVSKVISPFVESVLRKARVI